MVPPLTNPYKRTDVFQCRHPSHQKFNYRVSAYHILKEKRCFPGGCIFFEWHCSLMEKGQRCIHGFQYVGKKCRGCTYYLDEKFNFQPECLLSEEAYEAFLEEADVFDQWVEDTAYKRLACAGKILSVKPRFECVYGHQQKKRLFKGYLLMFKKGFIGSREIAAPFYVRITESQMKEYRFVSGMRIDFMAEMRYIQGRIVLFHPKSMEIHNRGRGYRWNRSKALVALKTGTTVSEQYAHCLSCTWSLLMDVHDETGEIEWRRELHCMKGVGDPENCPMPALRKLRKKRQR